MTTPRSEGFSMPAEWAPHTACWIAWPCRTYEPPLDIEKIRDAYAALARAISQFEPVIMLTPAGLRDQVQQRLGQGIDVRALPIADAWTRDMGPTFVRNGAGRLGGVVWQFNAWGGAVDIPSHEANGDMASRILQLVGAEPFVAPIRLEGGAIHTDGAGTVLTTESCILNPNRNPGLTKPEAERILLDYLGATKVIWLVQALEDGSDGHIDNLACFVAEGTVVALSETNPADEHYAGLTENLARLRATSDAKGRKLTVIPIQQPAARRFAGRRMPLSYINFYIANGAVILPVFDDPQDAAAHAKFVRLFPGRRIVDLCGLNMSTDMGCFHCATQQQPAVAY